MVQPTHTDSRDYSTNTAAMHRADALLAELASGRPVSPARIAEGRDMYLDMLWSGTSSGRGAAERGLLTIYAKAPDRAERARMIGELYAAGSRGERLLAELSRDSASTNLSPEELAELRDTAKLPVEERLRIIVAHLAAEGGRQGKPARGPRDGGPSLPDMALPPAQDKSSRASRTASSDGTPPDREEALAELKDSKVSNERRHERAVQLGRDAVPILGEMLLNDADQHEFAFATLVDLGHRPRLARTVHLEMQRIESLGNGGARRTAEVVRHVIENGDGRGGGPSDSRARERLRAADVKDDWLRSALESCDAVNILCASAGREPLAIALATRHLHDMRAARR